MDDVANHASSLRAEVGLEDPTASAAVNQRRVTALQKLPSFPSEHLLTTKELEVLRYMLDGYSAKAAAPHLKIMYRTFETHRARIFVKLGISNESQGAGTERQRNAHVMLLRHVYRLDIVDQNSITPL